MSSLIVDNETQPAYSHYAGNEGYQHDPSNVVNLPSTSIQGTDEYYSENQPDYSPLGQPGYPPLGQPGNPPHSQPEYPLLGQPGYGYPSSYTQQPMPSGSVTTTNVIVVQACRPRVIGAVYPSDYNGLAWFACLCCFFPTGIVAIYNAHRSRDEALLGDLDAANYYSQKAKTLSYISIVIGIVCAVLIGTVISL
ncbi:hypothetical protein QZH41_017852 [Actinostola sp. cb2023]|nr:hypothetical protein QZH41_017852 [Actinostola sp. cb2023]